MAMINAYKMDGLGNDFIIIDRRKNHVELSKDKIIELGKRSNIGFDQIIYIDKEIDYVVHLASCASPKAYSKFPINTLKSGSIGTINALGIAKKHDAKFFLASTSATARDSILYPLPENSPTTLAKTPASLSTQTTIMCVYDFSFFVETLYADLGLAIIILMLFPCQ